MRRKVKAFLNALSGSIVPQTPFYAKIIKNGFFNSLFYFLKLLFLVTIFSLLIIYIQISRSNIPALRTCLNNSTKTIPQNFILNIKNGLLSTNQGFPLFVWFNCKEEFHLLAVVDERANKEDINNYGAQLLFSSSQITFKYRQYELSKPYSAYTPNLYMNKVQILDYVNSVLDTLQAYTPFFVFFLILLVPASIWIINMVNLLLSSLFVYLFYILFKKHYSLRKIIQVGYHSSSLPLVISLLFLIFPIQLLNTLLLYFALYFIFQLVAVYEAHYELPSSHKRT